MKANKLILVGSFFIASLCADAHNDAIGNDTVDVKPNVQAASAVIVDSLYKSNQQKDAKIVELEKTLSEKEAEFEKVLAEKEAELKQKDLEIEVLTSQVAAKSDTAVQKMAEQADMILARLSNQCLNVKYDSVKVEEAKNNFDQMITSNLRTRYGKVRELMDKYGDYTKELSTTFATIESKNNPRELQNKFGGSDVASKCGELLKKTSFYKEAYKKDWKIPYLDGIMDEALQRIAKYKPSVTSKLILSDLLQ